MSEKKPKEGAKRPKEEEPTPLMAWLLGFGGDVLEEVRPELVQVGGRLFSRGVKALANADFGRYGVGIGRPAEERSPPPAEEKSPPAAEQSSPPPVEKKSGPPPTEKKSPPGEKSPPGKKSSRRESASGAERPAPVASEVEMDFDFGD